MKPAASISSTCSNKTWYQVLPSLFWCEVQENVWRRHLSATPGPLWPELRGPFDPLEYVPSMSHCSANRARGALGLYSLRIVCLHLAPAGLLLPPLLLLLLSLVELRPSRTLSRVRLAGHRKCWGEGEGNA